MPALRVKRWSPSRETEFAFEAADVCARREGAEAILGSRSLK